MDRQYHHFYRKTMPYSGQGEPVQSQATGDLRANVTNANAQATNTDLDLGNPNLESWTQFAIILCKQGPGRSQKEQMVKLLKKKIMKIMLLLLNLMEYHSQFKSHSSAQASPYNERSLGYSSHGCGLGTSHTSLNCFFSYP